MKLQKELKSEMTDIQRKICFKTESTEKAIFTSDIIEAKKSNTKTIKSVYLKDRRLDLTGQKLISYSSNNNLS